MRNNIVGVEFGENEVYTINIVAGTGDGEPTLADKKQTTIYKQNESGDDKLRSKASKSILTVTKFKQISHVCHSL